MLRADKPRPRPKPPARKPKPQKPKPRPSLGRKAPGRTTATVRPAPPAAKAENAKPGRLSQRELLAAAAERRMAEARGGPSPPPSPPSPPGQEEEREAAARPPWRALPEDGEAEAEGVPELSEEDRHFFGMLRAPLARPSQRREPAGFAGPPRGAPAPAPRANRPVHDWEEQPVRPARATSYFTATAAAWQYSGDDDDTDEDEAEALDGLRGPAGALAMPDRVRDRLTPMKENHSHNFVQGLARPKGKGKGKSGKAALPGPGRGWASDWGGAFEHEVGKVDVPLTSYRVAKAQARANGGQPKGRSNARPASVPARPRAKRAAARADPKDPVTRQMFDKRESRRKNKESFMHAVEAFRRGYDPASYAEAHPLAELSANVDVFVRKRPLFPHEEAQDEFDVVTVTGPQQCTVHNTQMYPDLKRMLVRHMRFPCRQAFDEAEDNRRVYQRSAAQLVEGAMDGGVSGLFMYGQTGSGKTYTMTSIEAQAAEHIFGSARQAGVECRVDVAMFELAGKHIADLLCPAKSEVTLKEVRGGGYAPVDAVQYSTASAEELAECIREASGRRATEGTDVNSVSSRSHAICRLRVHYGDRVGHLTLADCAGSERKEDSMYHNAERRKESAQINESLYALKECFRLHSQRRRNPHKAVHVPFRSSNLTRVLADCFTSAEARMAVICTLSPSSKDTEHSVHTLKTGCLMAGSEARCSETKEDVAKVLPGYSPDAQPRRVREVAGWSPTEVLGWFLDKGFGGRRAPGCRLPTTLDGRALVRMTEAQFASLCGGQRAAGAFFHKALRTEIERAKGANAALRREARAFNDRRIR